MRRIILSIVALLSCSGAFAQTAVSSMLDADPVSLAMGGTSLVSGYASMDNNASSISLSEYKAAAGLSLGMFMPKSVNEKMATLHANVSLGSGFGVGIFAKDMLYQKYQIYNESGISQQVNGTFTPKELLAGISVSYAISENLAFGVTAKYITASFAPDFKSGAFAGDVSATFAKDRLKAALSVCNIGTKLNSYSLPMIARIGAGYEIVSNLNASIQADYLFEGAFGAGVGAEYWIADVVSPRLGFHFGSKDKGIPTYASAGLGAKISFMHIDACYIFSGTFGGSMSFALAVSF